MRRGKERWTHEDDKRLGHALLDVFASQGEVVVLSDNCALWKSVQQRYQALAAAEQAVMPNTVAPRSARSLHTRWARSIRPDMVLFASLVDKLQKAGKKPAKAIKEAVKLFREERSEINAVAVRQYVMGRMRPPSPTGDSETDSTRPKLKFESFHFHHCYDTLRSNPRFIEALLEQCRVNGEGGARKRRRVDGISSLEEDVYSSSTSSDDSDTADSNEDEELLLLQSNSRFQTAKVDAITSEQVSTLRYTKPLSWKSHQATGNGVQRPIPHVRPLVQPLSAPQSRSDSVIITLEDTRDDLECPRLECDREVANEYIRLRAQTLQEDRRLKLLAELRGVVTTISQLAQQLAWNGVASAALAARTGAVCSQLDEDVLRDIAFFRGEKQRLKQAIAALDGGVHVGTQ